MSQDKVSQKEAKRAAALRENLKKRKAVTQPKEQDKDGSTQTK